MTDRVRTLRVLLDDRYRVDDAEAIIAAISLIRGVATVELGPVDSLEAWSALEAAKLELRTKLFEVLK